MRGPAFRGQAGLSLVELMIAIGILGIASYILTGVFTNMQSAKSASQAKDAAGEEFDQIMQAMEGNARIKVRGTVTRMLDMNGNVACTFGAGGGCGGTTYAGVSFTTNRGTFTLTTRCAAAPGATAALGLAAFLAAEATAPCVPCTGANRPQVTMTYNAATVVTRTFPLAFQATIGGMALAPLAIGACIDVQGTQLLRTRLFGVVLNAARTPFLTTRFSTTTLSNLVNVEVLK